MRPTDVPRISILLPVYNAEDTLPACLRSIQRQTFSGWECVIADDGSSDRSREVARAVAAVDERFSVLAWPHRGLVATLNAGLGECQHTYVARMDADDLMHRERLRQQVERLEAHPELVAVGCHVRLFPRAHLQAGWRAYESWLQSIRSRADVAREVFVESPIVHPTLMIRREVLQAYRYREMPWPEDYDLLLRLLTSGEAVGIVPRRLLSWRDSPARLSRTHAKNRDQVFAPCKAAFLASTFLAGSERYSLWGFGATGRALHAALSKHGKRLSNLIEMHPGRLGNTIHGARVIAPEEIVAPGVVPLIVSVAHLGPRTQIRAFLGERGYVELRDFVCAA